MYNKVAIIVNATLILPYYANLMYTRFICTYVCQPFVVEVKGYILLNVAQGGSLPLVLMHTRALMTYFSGGY